MSLLVLFDSAALAQPATGTATFAQAATWDSAASEKATGTASAAQTATWSGVASEELTAAITADQLSTWAAAAAEKQSGSASFAQVQTWDAVAAERLAGTAAFSQSATFAGQGTSLPPAITASATFSQSPVVWQSWHKLKIMGYASKVMPPEYSQATGQPVEVQ